MVLHGLPSIFHVALFVVEIVVNRAALFGEFGNNSTMRHDLWSSSLSPKESLEVEDNCGAGLHPDIVL